MSVDLEPDFRSKECKSMIKVIPRLLDFFDNKGIKATFFVVASLLDNYEKEIKDIEARGHEIASHSMTHAWLTEENVRYEMSESMQKFEERGIKCVGFRAPGFITTQNHFELLKEFGYKYDASLARFYPGRYWNLFMRGRPFVRKEILEFPMSTFVWPAIDSGLTYLKWLDPFSRLFGKPYIFYLHPWEFLEKDQLVPTRGVVSKSLLRNSGVKAWKIFEGYIDRCEGEWVSCSEWIDRRKKGEF